MLQLIVKRGAGPESVACTARPNPARAVRKQRRAPNAGSICMLIPLQRRDSNRQESG